MVILILISILFVSLWILANYPIIAKNFAAIRNCLQYIHWEQPRGYVAVDRWDIERAGRESDCINLARCSGAESDCISLAQCSGAQSDVVPVVPRPLGISRQTSQYGTI